VLTPAELIAAKVISMVDRSQTAKGLMDRADLRRLLLAFPGLKQDQGDVAAVLASSDSGREVLPAWSELVLEEILPENEDNEFGR
jgi:hypothetical protein